MEKKDSNLTIILLVIIIIILGVLCILFATDTIIFNSKNNNNSSNSSNSNKNESTSVEEENTQKSTFGTNDTFSLNTEYGQVDVLGYVKVKEVYDDLNQKKENYVFFNIVDTKSNDFLSYLEDWKGNSFISEKAIGLGCINNNMINYYNISDQYGYKNYQLSPEVSNKILNSTKDKPIKLRLNKMPITGGGEAPTCYSHITDIELIK